MLYLHVHLHVCNRVLDHALWYHHYTQEHKKQHCMVWHMAGSDAATQKMPNMCILKMCWSLTPSLHLWMRSGCEISVFFPHHTFLWTWLSWFHSSQPEFWSWRNLKITQNSRKLRKTLSYGPTGEIMWECNNKPELLLLLLLLLLNFFICAICIL